MLSLAPFGLSKKLLYTQQLIATVTTIVFQSQKDS